MFSDGLCYDSKTGVFSNELPFICAVRMANEAISLIPSMDAVKAALFENLEKWLSVILSLPRIRISDYNSLEEVGDRFLSLVMSFIDLGYSNGST